MYMYVYIYLYITYSASILSINECKKHVFKLYVNGKIGLLPLARVKGVVRQQHK